MSKEIIKQFGEKLVNDIKKALPKASGKTAASVVIDFQDDGFTISGNASIGALINGRIQAIDDCFFFKLGWDASIKAKEIEIEQPKEEIIKENPMNVIIENMEKASNSIKLFSYTTIYRSKIQKLELQNAKLSKALEEERSKNRKIKEFINNFVSLENDRNS